MMFLALDFEAPRVSGQALPSNACAEIRHCSTLARIGQPFQPHLPSPSFEVPNCFRATCHSPVTCPVPDKRLQSDALQKMDALLYFAVQVSAAIKWKTDEQCVVRLF
ncbi:hypothetical protein AVEN_198282-1 [Araneus ventricosus]|uniref:Uncharacterized protein n=1 Tax=Araneus ventricosus TaxID=182803 RepID=A0A4Y2PGF4_ARAVE|nr:hypothetical protein AVEN_198282-1 [Araneus ventricosus]